MESVFHHRRWLTVYFYLGQKNFNAVMHRFQAVNPLCLHCWQQQEGRKNVDDQLAFHWRDCLRLCQISHP